MSMNKTEFALALADHLQTAKQVLSLLLDRFAVTSLKDFQLEYVHRELDADAVSFGDIRMDGDTRILETSADYIDVLAVQGGGLALMAGGVILHGTTSIAEIFERSDEIYAFYDQLVIADWSAGWDNKLCWIHMADTVLKQLGDPVEDYSYALGTLVTETYRNTTWAGFIWAVALTLSESELMYEHVAEEFFHSTHGIDLVKGLIRFAAE